MEGLKDKLHVYSLSQALVKKKKKIKNYGCIYCFRHSLTVMDQSYPSSRQLNVEHLKPIP